MQTIESLDKSFKENNNKALIILPSGSGKTHTLAFHIKQKNPSSFLYLVHRNEILFQTVKIFKEICGIKDKDIGILNRSNKDFNKKYVFATVQTLSLKKNLQEMNKNIKFIAIDEFHHATAKTYQRILEYFIPKYLVGLTATPYRHDGRNIMDIIHNNVVNEIDLFEGIKRKILVPFEYIGLWDNIDYTKIKWSGYTYNIGDLDRSLVINKRDAQLVEEYNKRILPENRISIGFCNSVNHVNRITKRFNKEGISSASITFKQKPEERAEILENFRAGHYKVLFTRDILNEGVDFPECSALLFLRPTISKTIFFQQLGRGLRKAKGKKNVKILDFIGNYKRSFEKRQWFTKFTKEYTGENIKPEYKFNPQSKIYFDSKVIEMFDIQEKAYNDVSKQDILDDYLNCCAKENKILNYSQYFHSIYRKRGMTTLGKLYGNFSKFIYENNLPFPKTRYGSKFPYKFFTAPDKQELINNYYEVKKKWMEMKK